MVATAGADEVGDALEILRHQVNQTVACIISRLKIILKL